jgi:hypothetical protein
MQITMAIKMRRQTREIGATRINSMSETTEKETTV